LNFFRIPAFIPLLYPRFTWRIPTHEKIIYLTFDDGPVPGPTDFVLDTLAAFNAKATFFVIGNNVQKNPSLFFRLLQHGHAFGNHTAQHTNGWSASEKEYLEGVADFEKMLVEVWENTVGHSQQHTATRLFRPPYGRIRRKQAREILKQYSIVMWDVLTHDYDKRIRPQTILANTIRATRPGSIVVFHDSYKAEQSMKFVLPRFLEHYSSLGYSFQALPQNIQ
jgi:peptidoglycan/xylan/chitin deacetylase (PgdA/CDA1 family)